MEGLTRRELSVVVVAVIAAGLCSIVYELLIGTASSYFLGDSITWFSITIGLFMAAMGVGSFLSRAVGEGALERFVAVELALGVIGGLSIPLLYVTYAFTELYTPVMMTLIVTVGTLTGLEIPLLVIVMRRHFPLRENISNILSLDYLGALAATLLFPFVLLPFLGIFRSSLVVGALNLAVSLLLLRAFKDRLPAPRARLLRGGAIAFVGVIALLFTFSEHLLKPWHEAVYEDRVILSRQTPYQKIVMTRGKADLRMFLNGNLQFSTIDEHRYHEALVHPALSLAGRGRRVLVLGGGDGLGVREVLKHESVEEVTLVDLDPEITRLAKTHPLLVDQNRGALEDPRVTVVNEDAFFFLRQSEARWDVVIADLPDPNNASLARLYSREFFGLVERRLAKGGIFVTQATSPFFARRAYWCIEATVRAANLETVPYHAWVPSFGDWGFVMAARRRLDPADIRVDVPTRFLNEDALRALFLFDKDLREGPLETSTLDEPAVLSHYLAGWKHWN